MWRNSGILLAATFVAAIALVAQDEILHVSTELVTVTVSVMDKNGRPIQDMKREEFTVLDDERLREIQTFHQELDLPLTLGLVADISGSQVDFVKKHRVDLHQFFGQVLHPGDRAFLVSVPNTARLDVDFTESVELLDQAAGRLAMMRKMNKETFGGECPGFSFRKSCGTLLWNGVWGSAKLKLHGLQGRKAIVVLTDGQDTGSKHSLAETIEAAQGADAPVYTISSQPPILKRAVRGLPPLTPGAAIGRAAGAGMQAAINAAGKSHLHRLAEETGAAYFDVEKDLSNVFQQIEEELRHLYVLSFTLPESDRDGKFHKLEVKSSRADVKVRARVGYIAH
jgi:VWFA-related protein